MIIAVCSKEIVLYGAGSLRGVMAQIATTFGSAHGVAVTTYFGSSGRMRERVEKGEHVDVFTSADIGHARKLVQEGRASVLAMFARNTVCLLSPPGFGARTETILDKLLAPGVRIGASPAKMDPLVDYTVRLFEAAGQRRSVAGTRGGTGHAARRTAAVSQSGSSK